MALICANTGDLSGNLPIESFRTFSLQSNNRCHVTWPVDTGHSFAQFSTLFIIDELYNICCGASLSERLATVFCWHEHTKNRLLQLFSMPPISL